LSNACGHLVRSEGWGCVMRHVWRPHILSCLSLEFPNNSRCELVSAVLRSDAVSLPWHNRVFPFVFVGVFRVRKCFDVCIFVCAPTCALVYGSCVQTFLLEGRGGDDDCVLTLPRIGLRVVGNCWSIVSCRTLARVGVIVVVVLCVS